MPKLFFTNDGHQAVADEDRLRESAPEQIRVVAAAEVLGHEPRLERRVQQGGGDAAEQPPDEEDGEARRVLGEATQRVGRDVGQRRFFPPCPVGGGTDKRAKDHRGAEAGNEEEADGSAVKAVVLVEGVDVGPLEPVAGWGRSGGGGGGSGREEMKRSRS